MTPASRFVLTGIPGRRLSPATRRRLEALSPAGVVLFRRNIGTPADVLRLTTQLRDALGPAALIAVDQEGGRVARLTAPFTQWPPMRRLGEAGATALARAIGRAMGRELVAAGFNCDLAPVLDVDSNPANPVIGDRAFSSDPRAVARLALAFAAGLEDAGILPCGKHFPGHGDTETDSHLTLPLVRRPRAVLQRCELAPFRAAVRTGLPLLMTAHVVYTALDPVRPATLSPAILRSLLRERLGYRGAVVTDDLAMHALDGSGSLAAVAVASFAAGADLVLACQSLDDGEVACAALCDAARRGELGRDRLRESGARLRALRARVRRRPPATPPLRELLRKDHARALLLELEARVAPRPVPAPRGTRLAARAGAAARYFD